MKRNVEVLLSGLVFVLAAVGLLLHTYAAVLLMSGAIIAQVTIWALSCIPYLLCLLVATYLRRRIAALGGAIATLGYDFYIFDAVYWSPQSSTAGLAMLGAPLFSLFVMAPIGMLVGLAISALFSNKCL